MKTLIEKVMQFNTYPSQNPPWSGWEYVPKTEKEIQKFCDIIGYDWWEGVDWCCMQTDVSGKFVVAAEGHVWDVTEKEFSRILKKLGESL